jgi:hypothetical protein
LIFQTDRIVHCSPENKFDITFLKPISLIHLLRIKT